MRERSLLSRCCTGGPDLWGVTGRAYTSSCRYGGATAVFRAGERQVCAFGGPLQLLFGGGQDGTALEQGTGVAGVRWGPGPGLWHWGCLPGGGGGDEVAMIRPGSLQGGAILRWGQEEE